MNDTMRTGMAEASRLTQAGQLAEATAVIQRTLGGALPAEASSGRAKGPVDVTRRLHGTAPTSTSAAAELQPPRVTVRPADTGSGSATAPATRPESRKHAHGGRLACLRALVPASVGMPDRSRREPCVGGQFISGSYTNQAGTRAYKLYVPSGYTGRALPVVVMLHGCTQTPDDFANGTRMNVLAERDGFLVVYPAQAAPANQSKCWNWFKGSDQHRGQGEPSIIAGITRQVVSAYQGDARRVYVAGLSAGGAMATIMGVTYPDLYAAIGVHSGLAYGVAQDLPSAFAAMKHGGKPDAPPRAGGSPTPGTRARIVPTIVFHGDQDRTVHPSNGDQVLRQWATTHGGSDTAPAAQLRARVNRGQVPGGHAYTRSIYHDAGGEVVLERWLVHGAGHAWAGGSPHGSFTDPKGPDASEEMARFFIRHPGQET